MKKILMVGVAALASMVMAQEKAMSLADARGKIADIVSDASKMGDVMKQLSAGDQKSFLSEVNGAISKMPGSNTTKAAKYLDANRAALKAAKGNLKDLMAETYATVPPEALTVVNESFAKEFLNRDLAANKMSDEQFVKAATDTMSAVQARNAGNDNAGVRDTFAALSFLRASNGAPANLRETLVNGLPDAETRNLAEKEWITPALAGNYEPMLGAADAGETPDMVAVLRQSGPNTGMAMLADLGEVTTAMPMTSSALNLDQYNGASLAEDYGLDRIPRSLNASDKWANGNKRGSSVPSKGEPHGYAWQEL